MSTVHKDANAIIGEESIANIMTTVQEIGDESRHPTPGIRPRENFFDYLSTTGLKPEKAKELEAQKAVEEVKDCTFKPEISQASKNKAAAVKQTDEPIHDRLNKEAQHLEKMR